jgi:hypothetical protein
MRLKKLGGILLVSAVPLQPLLAQSSQTIMVPVGGTQGRPMPQNASAPIEFPEEIAKDAARDLKDNRFYNKPGATRAEYDADWQTCRLIARGSATPSGSVPYTYNPAFVSPIAAGVGGAVGGLIAGAIAEGQQRRANRQACLLIKGWRLVEVSKAEQTRLAALSDADRDRHFDTIVGAQTVEGHITARTGFAQPADPALAADAPFAGTGSVWVGKKVDPALPLKLEKGEGAVVIGFRRVAPAAAGRSAGVQLVRYEMDKRELAFRPVDWKKQGDVTTYLVDALSSDKKATYEVQIRRVTAGDYVLNATSVGPLVFATTNCFGAPVFHVGEGEVVYLGDFIPFMNVKLSTGDRYFGLQYASFPDDARKTLATMQPGLAEAMKPAALQNGATYSCAGITMNRWDLAGLDMLAPAQEAEAPPAGGGVGIT